MNKFIDAISWIVIGMGIALCLYMGFSIRETLREREAYQIEERGKIKAKMKFHGTPMAYEERGKWYFTDKQGRKCRL